MFTRNCEMSPDVGAPGCLKYRPTTSTKPGVRSDVKGAPRFEARYNEAALGSRGGGHDERLGTGFSELEKLRRRQNEALLRALEDEQVSLTRCPGAKIGLQVVCLTCVSGA